MNEINKGMRDPQSAAPFKIGVIVLTYNQESLLQTCIDSIISQELKSAEMEIYIVDDASTDSTKDIIERYASIYPNKVIPVFHETNQYQNGKSPEFPVIECLDVSHIAFCDGDDYWIDNQKLEKQIQLFMEDNSLAIVHTDYFFGRGRDSKIDYVNRTNKERKKASIIKTSNDLIQGNDIKKSTALFRKSAIDFTFLQKCIGVRAQDWLVAVSAGMNGGIHFIDEQTTCYRMSTEASFQSLDQKERLKMKNEVRWFCATNLPEGELRDEFRYFLIRQEIRKLISENPLYRGIRPVVHLIRYLKNSAKKLI